MSAKNEAEVINAVCKNKDFHVLLEENAGLLFSTYKDVYDKLSVIYQSSKTIPTAKIIAQDFGYFEVIAEEDLSATKYHLDRLRETFKEEKLKLILRDGAETLKNSGTDIALDRIGKNLSRLERSSVVVHDLNITDVEETVRHIENIQKMKDEYGDLGIKTGLTEFDFCLPMGIAPGQYGVIMAFPSVGKSWLAQYIAVQAWKRGRRPMILSAEMPEKEVRNRIMALIGEGKWSHRKLSSGEIDVDEFRLWGKENLEDKQDFIIISDEGLSAITPAVIRAKIEQHKPDIVFVDYLQLLDDGKGGGGKTESVMNLSIEMKRMAKSLSVPIVAIVSATPDKDQLSMEEPPQLGQTGWSKQVAYDADWALAMGREKNSGIMEMVFRKNRNGMLGDFQLEIDFDRGIWKSVGF